jgi:cysteine desulfurase
MSSPDGFTYLDHAATTPMRAEAVAAMLPFLTEQFANPSGSHRLSRQARQVVDESRDRVASVLGCRPGEVVFTSGGTEADNAAIVGAVRHGQRTGGPTVAVCPAVEHHAVLHVVEAVGGRVVGVDPTGSVDLDQLADALDERVCIVSVMAVNNEVGTVTALAEVADVVRRRAPQALVHTDAVQAACWLDLREVSANVQLMSLSAHKFGGPKGVGVLMMRDGIGIDPLLVGGGQERERRSGTSNVPGIVALAVALELTDRERDAEAVRLGALRDRLTDGLQRDLGGVIETVPRERKVAGAAHVCIEGVENEALLYLLDQGGVCASAASACASGAMEPSHVLAAMGVPRAMAAGAVRFSLGHTTSVADIDRAVEVVVPAVRRLREFGAARST